MSDERRKAVFLTAYRQLCEQHGFMVIRMEDPENDYTAFALARYHKPVMDAAVQEMLLEPICTISHEGPGE